MQYIDFNLIIVLPVALFFAGYMAYGLYYFFTMGDKKFDIKPIFKKSKKDEPKE